MGFFKSNKGTIISEMFTVAEDFAMFKKGRMVDVNLYETELKITSKDKIVTLSYSKITDVYYGVQSSIIEKDKSPIARAVVGSLLFGGTGAIVGAVSGTNKKEKEVNKFMFIISYTGNDGNENFLVFEDTRLWTGRKLSTILKDKCGLSAPKTEQHINL